MLGSRIFMLGGGVVQGQLLENSLNNVFFFSFSSAYFIVYRGGQIVYPWFYFRGNYFSQVSGGVPSLIQGGPPFSRGSNFFQGGGSKCSPYLVLRINEIFCMAMGVP